MIYRSLNGHSADIHDILLRWECVKNAMILETIRLHLRKIRQSDYASLCEILQDDDVMHAYEGAFDDRETQEWLDRQLQRYQTHGFGLWAVILKDTGQMIGQCGLTMQDWNGKPALEIGYLFQKAFWHQGYATEAAIACREYAFDKLKAEEVFSIIRDTNIPSQSVAKRSGMTPCGTLTKHYRGVEMPHLVFRVQRKG